MNYIVYQNRPSGIVTQTFVDGIRKAGQAIAYSLYYNSHTNSQKEATKLAMQAEKERYLTIAEKWYRILPHKNSPEESALCFHCGSLEHPTGSHETAG